MTCTVYDPLGCPGDVLAGAASTTLLAGWDAVCTSWAEAATSMLEGFAKAFMVFPAVNPESAGIRTVYGISAGIAVVLAAGLFLVQVARTAFTHDGSALAHGLVGLGKTVMAMMVTLSVTAAGVLASDQLTAWIVNQTFTNSGGLRNKIAGLIEFQSPLISATVMLIVAMVGIVLVLMLWFELLLCNAAVAVLVSTSPIAAAGQVSQFTGAWWPKLVSATAQLLILKPIIALVFAVGLGIVGETSGSQDLATLLSGLLILFLAAFAWPAIARFFTFAQIQAGGNGVAGVLGSARSRTGGGDSGAGTDPDQFGQAAEARTMSAMAARSNTGSGGSGGAMGAAGPGAGGASAAAGGAGPAAGAAGAGGAGAAGAGAGAGGAAAGVAGAGLTAYEMAQRAANAVAGRLDQTAGHAGLGGQSHGGPSGAGTSDSPGFASGGTSYGYEQGYGPGPSGTVPDPPQWPEPEDPFDPGREQ